MHVPVLRTIDPSNLIVIVTPDGPKPAPVDVTITLVPAGPELGVNVRTAALAAFIGGGAAADVFAASINTNTTASAMT